MDQIQSTQSVSFQAQQPTKTPTVQTPAATAPAEIKDGDNKSMQYLKYAGAALGAAAIVLTACKMMKGKTPEIDAKWFDLDALKKGEAVLTKEGKEEAAKLAKKCSGISKDGKIGDIKIKQADGDNTFTYIFKDGKRTQIDKAIVKDGKTKNISQIFNDKGKITKSIVDGKEVTLEYYGNGKLAKSTKDGVTTVYEYATIGTGDKAKEKLVRTITGDKTTEFKYNNENGLIVQKIMSDKKTNELKNNEFSYNVLQVDGKDKTVLSSVNTNYDAAQAFEYHDNGKLKSHASVKPLDDNNAISSVIKFSEKGEKVSTSSVKFNTNEGHLVFDFDNANGKNNIEISNGIEQQNGHRSIKFDLTNGDKKSSFTFADGKFTYTDEAGNITEFKNVDEIAQKQPELLKKISAALTESDKAEIKKALADCGAGIFEKTLTKMFGL